MTFLPIVVRELRVAARKRRTFWLRVVAALVALIVGSGILMLSMAGAFRTAALGGVLFQVLTRLALFTACAAGLFFTADCLSEEKREGTLGFLFLTDLRGYDVAGGKLLATSLRAFFALLAVFPILAVTLTMGGVTGAAFWKGTFALVNALFCSLTAGLFVSAISRDSQKALGGTLFLIIVWLAGGPMADWILSLIKKRAFAPFLSLSSPYYVFGLAGSWGPAPYWTGLLITQAIAWMLFSLASLLVPRTWQERPARTASATSTFSYAWRYGGRRRRTALRQKLIGRNPVLWLASRERWQSVGVWIFAVVVVGLLVLLFALNLPPAEAMLWSAISGISAWVLYLWAASQANRFFVEARRSGMVELILATPLSVNDIVNGQWRALGRMFAAPIFLILLMNLVGSFLGQRVTWAGFAGQIGSAPPWLLTFGAALAGTATTIANLLALAWFGMWMGLTSRNYSLATLKTLVSVQIIPALVISFASSIGIMLLVMPVLMRGVVAPGQRGMPSASLMSWFPLLTVATGAALTLAKDIGFIVWARRRLYSSFREQASPGMAMLRPVPPAITPPVIPPPVIPAPPPLAPQP
jgi:hypothetical protein